MRFRIRTIMLAVVIVGLVTALIVIWGRARDEIRLAHVEMAVARYRAVLAERRAMAAEARAHLMAEEARGRLVEQQAEEALQRSSHVDGDHHTSQKPPTRLPSVAQ
jgi:hypothetical protein